MSKIFALIVDMDRYHNFLPLFWKLLSINEQKKAKKYCNKLLINRYITSHGILRCIISHHVNQPAAQLEFTNNIYGKPFLKDNNIQFNMSHSHNIACYVLSFNNKVGVDVEFHDNIIDMTGISEIVFTKKEIELLKSFNTQEKYKAFYTMWTQKEALVKAIGRGLSYPINTIETTELLSINNILPIPENNESNKYTLHNTWYCCRLETPENYSGAIVAHNQIDKITYLEFDKLIENIVI